MLDSILSWFVLWIPVALGLVLILVPAKKDDEAAHRKWRYILGGCLIVYGAIVGWQQSRASHAAARDKQEIISQTSERVAKETTQNVTAALQSQYGPTINEMARQLGEQGEKVKEIGQSDIVTGKKPISVLVRNSTSGLGSEQPEVHIARLAAPIRPELGKNGIQYILTTNKVMNGGKVLVTCTKGKINRGVAGIVGAGVQMGGGEVQDEHSFYADIQSPNWSPDSPMLINLYFDDESLGVCSFKVL
jgi:hypothetical protein